MKILGKTARLLPESTKRSQVQIDLEILLKRKTPPSSAAGRLVIATVAAARSSLFSHSSCDISTVQPFEQRRCSCSFDSLSFFLSVSRYDLGYLGSLSRIV